MNYTGGGVIFSKKEVFIGCNESIYQFKADLFNSIVNENIV